MYMAVIKFIGCNELYCIFYTIPILIIFYLLFLQFTIIQCGVTTVFVVCPLLMDQTFLFETRQVYKINEK